MSGSFVGLKIGLYTSGTVVEMEKMSLSLEAWKKLENSLTSRTAGKVEDAVMVWKVKLEDGKQRRWRRKKMG